MAPAGLRAVPVLAALLLSLAACSRAVVGSPSILPAVGNEEAGHASWYGVPYHGRRAASGEVYDMRDLTAAHRTLPFGTRLMVTNTDTGQAVEVRVNDRGPFVEGRILDLSYAAARLLEAVGPGVIPVRLRVIALPGTARAVPVAAGGGGFSVQVGAFSSRTRAEALRDAVGGDVTIAEAVVAGQTFYRVRVGAFTDRALARAAAERLAARGFHPVVVDR